MLYSGGRPNLGADDSGEWVLDLQERLQTLGLYLGSLDGVLGERTATAVHEFALVHHVTPDSAADPQVLVGENIWAAALRHTDRSPTADVPVEGALSEDQAWVWHEGTWQPAVAPPRVADASSPVAQSADATAEHVSADGHWRWVDNQWQPNR